jgi:hypothetical protein
VINVVLLAPQSDDNGWTVCSPQIEGFSGGRETFDEIRRDLKPMLAFAGAKPGLDIQIHTEKVYETDSGEYVIRIANDAHHASRIHTAERLNAALSIPEQRVDLLNAPKTRTGEVLFICVEPSDRVRDLAGQLHPTGEAAVMVAAVAEQFIWAAHFANAPDQMPGSRPIEELGWSEDMTIADMMRADARRDVRHPPRVLVPTV